MSESLIKVSDLFWRPSSPLQLAGPFVASDQFYSALDDSRSTYLYFVRIELGKINARILGNLKIGLFGQIDTLKVLENPSEDSPPMT